MTAPPVLSQTTDLAGLAADLATLATRRDAAAWAGVVDRLGPEVHRLALRLTGDHSLAADAAQEAFLHVRDGSRHFRPHGPDDDAGARRWVLRVAAHATLMLMRGSGRRGRRERAAIAGETAAPTTPPEQCLENAETAAAVRAALADLPQNQREVLVLHHLQDLGLPEIAATLGIPVGTVKSRLHRAADRLRDVLQKRGIAAGVVPLAALHAPAHPVPVPDFHHLITSSLKPLTPLLGASAMTLWIIAAASLCIVTPLICVAMDADGQPPTPLTTSLPTPVPAAASAHGATSPAVVPAPWSGQIDGTVGQILARLRSDSGMDVRDRTWRDPYATLPVSFSAGNGMAPQKILDLVAQQTDVVVKQVGNTYFVDPVPHVQPIDPIMERELTLDYADKELVDVAADLTKQLGMEVRVTAEVIRTEPPPVTLKVDRMKAKFILSFIEKLSGLSLAYSANAMVFVTQDDPSQDNAIWDVTEAAEVIRHYGLDAADFVRRALPESTAKETVTTLPDGSVLLTVDGANRQVSNLLCQAVALKSGDAWDLIDHLHAARDATIHAWDASHDTYLKLLAKPVQIAVTNMSVADFAAELRQQGDANIVLGHDALKMNPGSGTVSGTAHTLQEALDLLQPLGLHYSSLDQAVYISGQGSTDADPEPKPLNLPHRPAPFVAPHSG